MRKEVEDLLRTEKERIFASGKQKRDKHLISIGLIDEGKTSRFYVGEDGYDSNNALYDNEKLKYYSENVGALDVTDEEYAEICKYFPPELTTAQATQSATAEKTLSTIAGIELWAGIILSVILLIASMAMEDGWLLLFIIPIILLLSIATWAFAKVFSNISLTLKEINKKVK